MLGGMFKPTFLLGMPIFRGYVKFPGRNCGLSKAKLRKAKRISSPGVMFVEHLNFSLLATKTCTQRTKDHKLIGELDGLH